SSAAASREAGCAVRSRRMRSPARLRRPARRAALPERRILFAALAGALAVLAGGCTMIPSYERPAAPVPATYPLETTPATGVANPAAAEVDWQRFFADPRLRRLIELSLAGNRDLRVAILNIEQARALYDVRRADELPTVGVGGSAARAATSNGSIGTVYTVGAAVTGYELDLFGRVRSLSEAALSQY